MVFTVYAEVDTPWMCCVEGVVLIFIDIVFRRNEGLNGDDGNYLVCWCSWLNKQFSMALGELLDLGTNGYKYGMGGLTEYII